MYKLDPPITGVWEYGDTFPDTFELDGQLFERSIRSAPYDGVVEQYRAAVPRDSVHLLVYEDGNWVIDHVDEYNPDRGHPVRHWIVDHPAGKGTVIAGAGVMGLIGAALYGESKKGKQ